jgi:hypothetical protein
MLQNKINFQGFIKLKKITPQRMSGKKFVGKDPIIVCTIGLMGKKRKSNYYNTYLHHFLASQNINWKYVEFGFFDNNLYIGEGTENDFVISKDTKNVSSKHLAETIFQFFNVRVPKNADEIESITFDCLKLNNHYKLIKR